MYFRAVHSHFHQQFGDGERGTGIDSTEAQMRSAQPFVFAEILLAGAPQ